MDFLKRDWAGEALQCWGNPQSNDILITWDKDTGIVDDNIRVGIDVGNIEIEFIQRILVLVKEKRFTLKTSSDEIIEAELSEIARVLAASNAEKYTSDPMKFLDDFQKGLINPE